MNKDALKSAMSTQWQGFFTSVCGIDASLLDQRNHPCPKCGGTDRFRAIDPDAGALFCNQCFREKNGDGFAATQWLLNCDFRAALEKTADYLGWSTSGNGRSAPTDPLECIARQKRVDPHALKRFGATVEKSKVIFPAYGPDGQQCTTFTLAAGNGRASKGLFASGKPAGLFFPHDDGQVRLPKPDETWLLVEGVKDAAALISLGYLAVGLNTCHLADKFARLFRGARVTLVPDLDTAGEKGAQDSGAVLHGHAKAVRIARLPGKFEEKDGLDVRDILARKDGEHQLRQAIDDARPWAPRNISSAGDDDLIVVGPDEARVIDQAVASLKHERTIFQRGGILVHVVRDTDPPPGIRRDKWSPRIIGVPTARLSEALASSAQWYRETSRSKYVRCRPPEWATRGVEARGQWSTVRRLEGVVEVPVLRPDGTVIDQPGYDQNTGLLYEPHAAFPHISKIPSIDQARQAAADLLEVYADFPFASTAHQSAMLAAVLTPFSRFAFHGPTPLNVIDANTPGTGKSLAADCVSFIFTGRRMPRTTSPKDDEEARKRITGLAMAGEPLVLVDNVSGVLGSASLDAALTATTWSDRLLGGNTILSGVPLTATWYATGNNVVLGADTARRSLHVRLESPQEKPEERTGFRHPSLLAWVEQQRPRLAVAAVTILRAYCAAGRPDMKLTPWGSFEAWSDLVRQAIAWIGYPDPGETRQELASQADREASALRLLIDGLAEADPAGDGMSTSAILRAITERPDELEALRSAITELVYSPSGKLPSCRAIGMKLSKLRRRVACGRYLDCETRNVGKVWYVFSAEKSGTSETCGTFSAPDGSRSFSNSTCNPCAEPRGTTGPSSTTFDQTWEDGIDPSEVGL